MAATAPGCTQEQFELLVKALGSREGEHVAAALCATFATNDAAQQSVDDLRYGLNTFFLIYGGAMVFVMHGGFAMLEAGAIRHKNAMNILLQTVLDGAASALCWYLLGFGFAYGEGANPNQFIGDALYGMSRYESHFTGVGDGRWTDWFFQWAFAATAATIPAGAVAERFNFYAYIGYSVFISSFVYPVVVHWVWSRQGWLGYGVLEPVIDTGMIDFAGSAVVHMVGGLTGLMGAVLVGPRMGRFDSNGKPVDMPGHSAILVVLGTVLLWFGWYGFNPASALIIDNPFSAQVAGRAACTTTLAGAAGGVACLLSTFVRTKTWDLVNLCNGMLVGFVVITASCHVMEPWAAIIGGATGGVLFDFLCLAFLRLRIDDPLSAAPMHGFCGMWGIIYTGLLAKEEYVQQSYARASYPYGLFYGGGGKLLASQVIGLLTVAGWVCGLMGIFFGILKYFKLLRIPKDQELKGLDKSYHGGAAYNHYNNTMGSFNPREPATAKVMAFGSGSNPNSPREGKPVANISASSAVATGAGDAIMRNEPSRHAAAPPAFGGGNKVLPEPEEARPPAPQQAAAAHVHAGGGVGSLLLEAPPKADIEAAAGVNAQQQEGVVVAATPVENAQGSVDPSGDTAKDAQGNAAANGDTVEVF